ncbi:hypothetical protein D3C84_1056400 [compost metagenome]
MRLMLVCSQLLSSTMSQLERSGTRSSGVRARGSRRVAICRASSAESLWAMQSLRRSQSTGTDWLPLKSGCERWYRVDSSVTSLCSGSWSRSSNSQPLS